MTPEGLGGSPGSAKPHSPRWVVKLGAKRGPELPPSHSTDGRWLWGHRFGDTKLRQHPSTDTRRRFPGIRSSPAFFSAAHTRPSAERPVRVPSPAGDKQCPATAATPVTASPAGDHASPRKALAPQPGPRPARQRKSHYVPQWPDCPPQPPGSVPPAPGLPHALGPIKGPSVALGGWREGGGRAPRAPRGVR